MLWLSCAIVFLATALHPSITANPATPRYNAIPTTMPYVQNQNGMQPGVWYGPNLIDEEEGFDAEENPAEDDSSG